MAITNHERVGKAMELLREGLAPFIERELKTEYGEESWFEETKRTLTQHQLKFIEKKDRPEWDVANCRNTFGRPLKPTAGTKLARRRTATPAPPRLLVGGGPPP